MQWARGHAGTLVVTCVVAAVVVIAQIPTTTNIGVDYAVEQRTQPLYAKAIAFVDRDIQMHAIAIEVARGVGGDEERIIRLLEWTKMNVRPQPRDFPVVDDHPYHVLVRGYGTYDQAADVLATLAAYAGIPATVVFTRPPGAPYAFTVARVAGDWTVIDAREGRVFRDKAGRLATLEALRSDASLTAGLPTPRETTAAYPVLLAAMPAVPDRLRPYDQMLLWRPLHRFLRDH